MEFENKDLCAWLEDGLKTILESKSEKVCLCAILPDGDVVAGYYNCDATDKAVLSHHINSDAMLEVVIANIDKIRDALEE